MADHDWEDIPNPQKNVSDFVFKGPEGEVHLHLEMTVVMDPGTIKSLRRCRRCYQEELNGEEPRDSCDMAVVRQVMES